MVNMENTSQNINLDEILDDNGISDRNFDTEYEESHDGNQENRNDESSLDEDLGNTVETDSATMESVPESNQEEPVTIPQNSPTFLADESTLRFSGAEWFQAIQKTKILLAGVGGIGSNLAFQLARMAPGNITLYDDDLVEEVNMAGQLYSYYDLGKAKVDAMAHMISSYTSIPVVHAIRDKFTHSSEPGDIMMCGFDNMEARKLFFDSWYGHVDSKPKKERGKCLFLDGRLSMDTLQIFCFRGDDGYNIKRYAKEFLFSDSEADSTVCSMKQTTYLACMIGSLMTNLFVNFIADSLDPVIPYDLPFFTEYDAKNMIFKTEN